MNDRTPDPRVTTRDGIVVKVGQTWRDCDPRMFNRTAKVVKVDPDTGKAFMHAAFTTKVSIRRMYKHSTGWELVSE